MTQKKQNQDIVYTTKDIATTLTDIGSALSVEKGRIVWAAKAYSALKNVGLGFIFDKAIKKESSRQAALSNFAGLGAAEAVSTVATSALVATTLPETVAIGGTVAAGSLAYGMADSYVDKNYKSLKKDFGQIGKLPTINIPQMSSSNQNNNQSLFNKTKLYIKKNQKADITVPTEKELLNVSNSAVVQQVINQNNAVQVIEHIPAPVIKSGGISFLSKLSNVLGMVNGITNIAMLAGSYIGSGNQSGGGSGGNSGGNSSTSRGGNSGNSGGGSGNSGGGNTGGGTRKIILEGHVETNVPSKLHTGGKVMGRGDILAILKGGETVRTEAQEKELQEQMLKKHFESFAPLVSGQANDEQNQQNGAFSSYSEKKSAKPVLQDRTRHDEEMIIGIIADAWKSNRSGFRRILKSC